MSIDPTPLQSTPAVAALWAQWRDPRPLLEALRRAATWGQLHGVPEHLRRAILGVSEAVPAVCPPLPLLPLGGRTLTPYDATWPARMPAATWPVMYLAGALPHGGLLIVGSRNPGPRGVEMARAGALAAVAANVPVTAPLLPGSPTAALKTAVAAGGKALALLPAALGDFTPQQGLLEEILNNGGAVMSVTPPGCPAVGDLEISRIAAHLSSVALVADVGGPQAPECALVRACVERSLPLIAPTPRGPGAPVESLGVEALGRVPATPQTWFGPGARLDTRIREGLPGADVLVDNQADITRALASLM